MSGIRLTVFFEDPFWVAWVERREGEVIEVARVVLGPSEPTGAEVRELVLGALVDLPLSPPIALGDHALRRERPPERRISPKRAARLAALELAERGGSTQAQEAMRVAIEQHAKTRATERRDARDAAREAAYEARARRRKKKRRGH